MNKNIVYYSEIGSTVNREILKKLKNNVKKDLKNKFQYILPNNELIREYNEQFLKELGTHKQIKIETFDDILYKNFNIKKEDTIREELKRFLIKKSIKSLDKKGKIKYYQKIKDYPGFIENLSTIISSFKSSLISPDTLNSTKNFYKEIFLIYKKYEEIKDKCKLIDREDLYFKLKSDDNKIYLDKDIKIVVVDQFFRFTKVDLKILEKIIMSGYEVKINYPYNAFNLKNDLINEDLINLEKIGFQIVRLNGEKNKFYDLGRYIIEGDNKIESLKNINIYKAVDKQIEVENIITDINNKLSSGIKEEEILVLTLDDDYLELLNKIGAAKGVSFDISIEKPLYHNRVIEILISILSLMVNVDFKENLLEIIKIFNLTTIEVYRFLLSLEFKSLKELSNYLKTNKEILLGKDDLMKLLNLLNSIEEKLLLKDKGSIIEYNQKLRDFLEEIYLEEKLLESLFRGENFSEINIQAYNIFIELLKIIESYEEVVGKITKEEYLELITTILKDEKLVDKERIKGIKVLNLDNNFGWSREYTYILGASQNNFPRDKDINFFLSERNIQSLRKYGLEISNIKEKTLADKIKLTQFILNTKKEINLSFTEDLEEGISGITIIDQLNKDYNLIKEENILSYNNKIKSLRDINNQYDLEEYILMNRELKEIDEILEFKFTNYLKEKRKNLRKFYGDLSEDKKVIENIKDEYKNKTYSPSPLEVYNNCPYRFLLSQVLKIEKFYEPIVELDYLTLGKIEHKILENVYKNHESFNIDQVFEMEFNKAFKELKIENPNIDTILKLKNSYENLKEFIIEDFKRIEKLNIKPLYFEKDIENTISYNDEKINLSGRIDRIDLYNSQLVVIDYKRNSYNRLKEMLEGNSLELPIYLLLLDQKPIAGLYGVLMTGNFEYGLSLIENNLGAKGIRNCKIRDKKEFYNKIIIKIFKIKSGIESGNYLLNKENCSKYCIFREICRKEDLK